MANAEEILRRSLEKIAAEQNYTEPQFKISKVTTDGANYTSFLFAVTISSKGKDDLNLFAKVAAVGEKMRAAAPMRVFDVEHIFYTELLQEYRKLEDKHNVPIKDRLKVPKIYNCSPKLYEETVVMENLATQGYTLHDRFKSVDWPYAAASFTELAKLHSLSIALRHEKPEVFQKMVKEFTIQMNENDESMKEFIEKAMGRAIASAKDEHKARLMAFMGQFQGIESFLKYFMLGERPVIRHGDYRPSNLLNRLNKDGSVDLIPVDYQTLVGGSPVMDLFYFIFLGTDQQFREKYYERLLDHYYTQLSATITRLGLNPEDTYSRKNFDDDVKENLSYGLTIALTTLALITVEAADAPKISSDLDISSFQDMKISDSFSERFNGILEDFVRWGVL